MYDPLLGQFISVDPLADKYPGLGAYVYCANNPLRYTDPTGMDFWSDIGDLFSNMVSDIEDLLIQMEEAIAQVLESFDDILEESFDGFTSEWGLDGKFSIDETNTFKSLDIRPYVEIDQKLVQSQVTQEVLSTRVASSSGDTYSIDNAVKWLNDNAHSSWKDAHGECGIYIRYSLEAGFGLNKDALKGKTVDQTGKAIGAAKTMGPYLEGFGFNSVNTTSYLKGDISVIQGYPGAKSNSHGEAYGHVQMYNGSLWISDFKQLIDFWPGGGYRKNTPSFVIFRWGD